MPCYNYRKLEHGGNYTMEQNLNLYRIFYEAAKCRSLSGAAKKLYISQPAVSKAIARLEESMNTALFFRSSRGVALTPEGELLCRHVEDALASLQSGEELLRYAQAQGIRRLSIGVSTTLCKYVLLPLLKPFVTENPNIKITISCQPTLETISALRNNTIDIGLVGIPSDENISGNSGISYLPLKTIEDIFVVSRTYLTPFLQAYGNEPYANKLFFEEAAFIMLDKDNISRKHADNFLAARRITLSNIIEVNNMDLSIEFARAGLGIACVIRDFVENDIKNGTLTELELGKKIPQRRIGFAYSGNKEVSKAMELIMRYYSSLT